MRLNSTTPNTHGSFTGEHAIDLHDTGPRVAMEPTTAGSPAGFVVTWANFTNTTTGYNVYAQQFAAEQRSRPPPVAVHGQPDSTANWQLMPAVGVDGRATSRSFGRLTARIMPITATPGSMITAFMPGSTLRQSCYTAAESAGRIPRECHDPGQSGCPRGRQRRPQRRLDHRLGGAGHEGRRHNRDLSPRGRSAHRGLGKGQHRARRDDRPEEPDGQRRPVGQLHEPTRARPCRACSGR